MVNYKILLDYRRSNREPEFITSTVYKVEVDCVYNIGEHIGQLIIIPYPKIEFEKVDELLDSDRGSNGYSSSGI